MDVYAQVRSLNEVTVKVRTRKKNGCCKGTRDLWKGMRVKQREDFTQMKVQLLDHDPNALATSPSYSLSFSLLILLQSPWPPHT